MKKSKKILSMLLALIMMIGMMMPVFAEGEGDLTGLLQDTKPDNTVLVIHKLQADSYDIDDPIDHNGGLLDQDKLDQLGTNVRELDGVTFTWYKVSEQQLETMKANPNKYDTTDEMAAVTNEGTGTVTTAGGQGATLNNLADGYYWFVESDAPDSVSSFLAVPFGISLPVTVGNQYLKTVHVYPKNTTGEEPTPDKTVDDLTNKDSSHNVGDPINWYLQATIPANIKDYYVLKISDTFSDSLSYKGNVVVKYGAEDNFDGLKITLEKDVDYTIKEPALDTKGGDLEIVFTAAGIEKLAENYVEDGKLVAQVQTIINEDAIMGLEIPNNYTLTFNHNPKHEGDDKTTDIPEPQRPKVYTGGKRFIKVDSAKKALENAIFQLQDDTTVVNWTADLIKANQAAIKAGQFAVLENDEYVATSDAKQPTVGQPIYLRSDKDGAFEIKGLEYSEWTKKEWSEAEAKLVVTDTIKHNWNLKEVKAPEGYGLLNGTVTFVVNSTSYYQDPTKVDLGLAEQQEVENKKMTIPQTGGIGTAIFAVVGIALMGGAIIAMRKRNSVED